MLDTFVNAFGHLLREAGSRCVFLRPSPSRYQPVLACREGSGTAQDSIVCRGNKLATPA
jgi:hypothetical protein